MYSEQCPKGAHRGVLVIEAIFFKKLRAPCRHSHLSGGRFDMFVD